MRRIAVVTGARSDYGYLWPVMKRIQADPELELLVVVTGMHLSPEFGLTVDQIVADGFEIAQRVEMVLSADTPSAIGKSMGLGLIGMAQAYESLKPDLLVVLGDRYETLAAAAAMMPYGVPIAHIAGGETSQGAVDENIRHALTKLSHLHFVSTEAYRQRIIQMGEEPWRVVVSGAPTLDNLAKLILHDQDELERELGVSFDPQPLLVTFHPVTLEPEQTTQHVDELLSALNAADRPILFTYPNADAQGRMIIDRIEQYIDAHNNAKAIVNLGTRAYFSAMKNAAAMVGNSSSGIIEAGSFGLPVVNVGNRQQGRIHGPNVIDTPCRHDDVLKAIVRATDPEFRHQIAQMKNPYGEGRAAEVIVRTIKETPLDQRLRVKRFHDISTEDGEQCAM